MSSERVRVTQNRFAFLRACLGKWLPRHMRTDERGAAAVEFAIIAPFFFFLMFVIAETAMIFIAEQVMDNAVFESARLIRTGQVQKGGMSQGDFKQDVCGRMAVFVSCDSNFYLDVRSFDTFADLESSKPIDSREKFKPAPAFDFGQSGDIVMVRAYYQWPTSKMLGGMSLQNLSNGKRLIGSFAAFRNEPFERVAQTP